MHSVRPGDKTCRASRGMESGAGGAYPADWSGRHRHDPDTVGAIVAGASAVRVGTAPALSIHPLVLKSNLRYSSTHGDEWRINTSVNS